MSILVLFTFIILTIFIFVVSTKIILSLSKNFRRVFIIPEGSAGLLYRHGLFVRRNNAGRHVIWGDGWTLSLIDLRRALLLVAGQEVFTIDGVALKLSLIVTYQVTDPTKAAHETQNWSGELNQAAQLALRAIVNGNLLETLLSRKPEIGTQLLGRIKTDAEKIGVTVLAAELKDVLPSDLKRTFAKALKVKPESQAVLTGAAD